MNEFEVESKVLLFGCYDSDDIGVLFEVWLLNMLLWLFVVGCEYYDEVMCEFVMFVFDEDFVISYVLMRMFELIDVFGCWYVVVVARLDVEVDVVLERGERMIDFVYYVLVHVIEVVE